MDNKRNYEAFNSAINAVSKQLKIILYNVNDKVKCDCSEIRLRRNLPVVLTVKNKSLFLHNDSSVSLKQEGAFICSDEIISDTFMRMCSFSMHSHLADIVNGFVTLDGGHRAGVVGTAALDKNSDAVSIRDISSINIRISREIHGCSDELFNRVLTKGIRKGLIIVGPPASGKTTVLRDTIRKLSDNGNRISVIDERFEIASQNKKGLCYDLGMNTDVYSGYSKIKAINISLRTMSPQIIAIDEVCDDDEIKAITSAANCGVKILVTVHASTYNELLDKNQILSLLNTNAFDTLVLLMGADKPGKISGIFDTEELHDEILRHRIGLAELYDGRSLSVGTA